MYVDTLVKGSSGPLEDYMKNKGGAKQEGSFFIW